MKPFVYIGIDPGVTGAVAFYRPSTGSLVVYDMPTRPQGETGRREVCPNVLAEYLGQFCTFPSIAIIEKVHSMPRDGVVQSFSLGRSFGIALGVLASHKISAIETRPAVWKSLAGLSAIKSESIELARKTFPRHRKMYFKRQKDNGRAEAAMLAFMGERIWKG